MADSTEDQWDDLNRQVVQLYGTGRYTEAIRVGERAVAVAEQTFGSEHPNTASSLA